VFNASSSFGKNYDSEFMKSIVAILLILSCHCIAQNAVSPTNPRDSSNIYLKKKNVKTMTKWTHCNGSDNNQGNCEIVTYFIKYDQNGNRIETHHFKKDATENSLSYRHFDDFGNILTELNSRGDTLEGRLIIYYYNALGRVSHKDNMRKDSIENYIEYSVYYEYNLDSLPTKSFNMNKASTYGMTEYFYDKFNNLCLEKQYKVQVKDTILTGKDSTIYNARNKEIASYNWSRYDGYHKYTEFEYDSLRRNTKFIIYNSDGESYNYYNEFKYNKKSQVIIKVQNGLTSENIYSEEGRLIKQIVKWNAPKDYPNGNVLYEHTYSYTYYE
jgi:hypothetical protein